MNKKRILLLSVTATFLTSVFTLLCILFVPKEEYVEYQKLLLGVSYSGIFNLGVYNTYRIHFRKKSKKEISKQEIILIFILNTIVPLICLVINNVTMNYDINLILSVIVIVNIYSLQGLLLQLFNEYAIYYYLIIASTIFSIIFINSVNIIILFITGKVLMIGIITIYLFKHAENKGVKIKGYKKGMVLLIANWLVIVILNFDKNLVLSNQMDFYSYSIVSSISLTILTIFNPFSTMIYNSDFKYESIKSMIVKIYYAIFCFLIIGFLIVYIKNIFVQLKYLRYDDVHFIYSIIEMINFNNLFQFLQVFLVLSIVNILVPKIIITNFKAFLKVNIIFVICIFLVLELVNFSTILQILIFRYLILSILIYSYLKVIKLSQVVLELNQE